MLRYPVHPEEADRIESLYALGILDTSPSPEFNSIANVARLMFDCPMATVSFVDTDRQWFKAEIGFGVSETSRRDAICNYTLLEDEVFIVEDASDDERFRAFSTVVAAPNIRFYAGVPIRAGNKRPVGTLCVLDTVSRTFNVDQQRRLAELGAIATSLVDGHAQRARFERLATRTAQQSQEIWRKNRLLQEQERIAGIGGWELDLRNNLVHWSEETYRIHEIPVGTPINLENALAYYPGASADTVRGCVETTMRTGEAYEFEVEFLTARGNRRWVRSHGEAERVDGRVVRLFGLFQDVTVQRQRHAEMWRSANFDDLTRLPNRSYFNRTLEEQLNEAPAGETRALALAILDLDGFKEINDSRGHQAGDAVLHEVAVRLAAASDESVFLARLGGDEFAALIYGPQDAARLRRTALRFIREVARPIKIGGERLSVSASCGLALAPVHARSPSDLMRKADIALYRAKQLDRGSVTFFAPQIAEVFEHRREAIELARKALAGRRVLAHYQPQVDIATGRLLGFEALVRIRDPSGAILGPTHFGHAFSNPEITRRIGDRMLEIITADIAAWRAEDLDPGYIGINVTEADFAHGDLADRILKRLAQTGVPPVHLKIEVTETVFLGEGANVVASALERLSASGVRIALDDFGTGYASLTHLRDFPIDCIKIDQSFVKGVDTAPENATIVRAVIDLGHNLGMHIVAEGVETAAQARFLLDAKCDIAQGYLFGVPDTSAAAAVSIRAAAARLERDRL